MGFAQKDRVSLSQRVDGQRRARAIGMGRRRRCGDDEHEGYDIVTEDDLKYAARKLDAAKGNG